MDIYITRFDPATKAVTESAQLCPLKSFDAVVELYGEPTYRGKRTVTYASGWFFSAYALTFKLEPKPCNSQ